MTLTASDNGNSVDVALGETLVLLLRENAATGYRWAFDGLDPTCIEVHEGEYLRSHDTIGGGALAQWTLVPLKACSVEVRLKRWRHWVGDPSIRERFAVTLRIT